MLKRGLITALMATACALSAATPALADIEPNSSLPEAEGPLFGGQTYSGTIVHSPGGVPESDWYYLRSTGQHEIDLTVLEHGVGFVLRDGSGSELATPSVEDFFANPPEQPRLRYTTSPTPQVYYLQVSHEHEGFPGSEVPYSFRLEPPAAFAAGPSPFAPILWGDSEPNNTRRTASGPIAGATTYTGVGQTMFERDFFYFYGRADTTLSITVATRGELCDGGEVTLFEAASGRELPGGENKYDLAFGWRQRTRAGWPKKYLLRIECESYAFRIEPANAILDPCTFARVEVTRLTSRTSALLAARKRLKWGPAYRSMTRRIKQAKRDLRRAGHRKSKAC